DCCREWESSLGSHRPRTEVDCYLYAAHGFASLLLVSILGAGIAAGRQSPARGRSQPMAQIAGINRYPIKGLSAEPLGAVEVAAGQGLPLDRKFALARPNASFDPDRPAWLPKRNFLMLMTDERLATLRVAYEDAEGRLTIEQGGQRVLEADLRTASGRAAVERFFEAFMGGELQGRPRLVSAPGHMFP